MSGPTQAFPLAAVSESTLTVSRNLGLTSGTIQGAVQGGGRRRRPATEKRRIQKRTAQRKYSMFPSTPSLLRLEMPVLTHR